MRGRPVYAQRPSKAVTRAILVEWFQRLAPICAPSKYQYVGFGALEFIDFDLVHRRLGISRMTSIEKRPGQVERQAANVPFNGIDVIEGDAKVVLPQLDWTPFSIVWLDFEDGLNYSSVIPAVEYVARKLRPGSALAVTLRAEPHRPIDQRLTQLENDIGPERVPVGTTSATLGEWGTAAVQYQVLDAIVRTEVGNRTGQQDVWHQVLNVQYADETKMQIVGGVIGDPVVDRLIASCGFKDLSTYRPGDKPLRVEVPYLTPKEQRLLNEKLPRRPRARLGLPGVKREAVEAYAAAYRWLEPSA